MWWCCGRLLLCCCCWVRSDIRQRGVGNRVRSRSRPFLGRIGRSESPSGGFSDVPEPLGPGGRTVSPWACNGIYLYQTARNRCQTRMVRLQTSRNIHQTTANRSNKKQQEGARWLPGRSYPVSSTACASTPPPRSRRRGSPAWRTVRILAAPEDTGRGPRVLLDDLTDPSGACQKAPYVANIIQVEGQRPPAPASPAGGLAGACVSAMRSLLTR